VPKAEKRLLHARELRILWRELLEFLKLEAQILLLLLHPVRVPLETSQRATGLCQSFVGSQDPIQLWPTTSVTVQKGAVMLAIHEQALLVLAGELHQH
jgi:hypothetical protein